MSIVLRILFPGVVPNAPFLWDALCLMKAKNIKKIEGTKKADGSDRSNRVVVRVVLGLVK